MYIIFFSLLIMINHSGGLAQISSVQPTSTPIIVNMNANRNSSMDFNLLNTPNAVIALSIVGGIIGLACLWLLICFIRRQPRKITKLSEKGNVSGLYSGDYNEQQWNQQHGPIKATDNIARSIVPSLSLPISNNNDQWDGLTMSESEGGPSVLVKPTLPSVHNASRSSKKSHYSNNQNNKIYHVDADYENQRYNERPSSYINNGAGRDSSRLPPSDYRPSEKFPFSEENVFVFENLMHTTNNTSNSNSNSNNQSFAGVDVNGIDRNSISISPRATVSSSRQSMMNPLRRDPPSFRASLAHPAYREITRAGGMRSSLEGSMMNRGSSNISSRRDRDSSDNSLSLRWSESFHSRAENSIANSSSGRPQKNEFAYDPEIERRLDQENNNASTSRYTDIGNQTPSVPSPSFKPPPPTQSRQSQQQQSSPRQVVNANGRHVQSRSTREKVISLADPSPVLSYHQISPRYSQYEPQYLPQQRQLSPHQQLFYEQQYQYPQQQQHLSPHQLQRQSQYEQQYPPRQQQLSPRQQQLQYEQQHSQYEQQYQQQSYALPYEQQYYQEPQQQQQYTHNPNPTVQSSSRFQSPSSSPQYQPPPPMRTQQSQQKQSSQQSASRYSSPLYNNVVSTSSANTPASTTEAALEMTNSSRASFPSPRNRMSYNRQPSPLQRQPQLSQQQTSMRSPLTANPHYNDSDSDSGDDQLSYAESMLSHPAIKRQSEIYQSRSLAAAISASGANSPRRY